MGAVWSGVLSFGLVSIPVKLYVAARPETVSFNQLHAACHSRLRQKLACPACERDVERAEIVKGYKLNGYVILDDADFEAAEREGSRALEVLEFVDAATVDPVYLERSYYLAPQEASERAYHVLLRALSESNKAAIVRFVMGTRQYHALIRSGEGKLVLHTLYYTDEVRELEAKWKAAEPSADEVALGIKLIEALARDFDATKYQDEHRAKLMALIRAKGEGRAVVLPEAPVQPAPVVDLMEALRQSIAEVRKPLAKAERAERPVRRAPAAAAPTRRASRR